jgi:hypothetical protein
MNQLDLSNRDTLAKAIH